MAQALQSLPKPSQTVDPAVTVLAKSLRISKNLRDQCAPAGVEPGLSYGASKTKTDKIPLRDTSV